MGPLCLFVLKTEVSGRPQSNDSHNFFTSSLLSAVLVWCDVIADYSCDSILNESFIIYFCVGETRCLL